MSFDMKDGKLKTANSSDLAGVPVSARERFSRLPSPVSPSSRPTPQRRTHAPERFFRLPSSVSPSPRPTPQRRTHAPA
jgi:hypothetical protein